MKKFRKNNRGVFIKDHLNIQIRKKLGATQEKLGAIFRMSRAAVSHIESGRRDGHSQLNSSLANIFMHFHELETGVRPATRSLETTLFLNEEYKKLLPKMEATEKDCRARMQALQKELATMKEAARDAEYSIIVITAEIKNAKDQAAAGGAFSVDLAGLDLLKQDAYTRLLTCWEPEQAKLHGKMEALAGEAKALRRHRIKVNREYDPFKKNKAGKE